ncbi:hypothetical protein WSM22_42220 [Cytophagales bacterium WSM2-2]|nr:hypothetical protein WSM22_42220 [Cytophagales bacterium WSM2-2]
MRKTSFILVGIGIFFASCSTKKSEPAVAETTADPTAQKFLFMDVHDLEPGKVKTADVAGAHQKDLATQGKYGVEFKKYWVDEALGKVYCLVESPDSATFVNAHKEAHGLIPTRVNKVLPGMEASIKDANKLFFDVHRLGAGKVNAQAVAEAHQKDLATQNKYKTNFVNYWVDEKLGVVMCLAEAPDANAMIATHKEAHGLIPDEVHKVNQGQ